MASASGVSFSLKQPAPRKSKKAARDAEKMRELNNIFETRFRGAGLPEEPYVMSLDDRYDTFSRYGYRNHPSVRNTPFAPEEAYLQYQSFFYRDFYAMDDCNLRLHNPQDEVFLKRMGIKPATAQSTSETKTTEQPGKERKKISLKDYQARSKAGSQVSTPVVPHAEVADLRKEALKNAFVEKDHPAAEAGPRVSTEAIKSTQIPDIKVDTVESKSPDSVSLKDEKALNTSDQATSHASGGTKRKHEDLSTDTQVKSDVSPPPPPKKAKSTPPEEHADTLLSSLNDSNIKAVNHQNAVIRGTSTVAKTTSTTKQNLAPLTSNHTSVAALSPPFPNPTGKKRKREPSSSPPRFTSEGRNITPSSPDTVGPRNVSSTNSSQSSAHSKHSVLWSSDSDHAQATPSKPKPKPTQVGVARPVQTVSNAPPQLKLPASVAPLKPKVGTGIAKKVVKHKKSVTTGNAAFMQSVMSSPMLTGTRPTATSAAPPSKPTIAGSRPIASDALKKNGKLVVKLKYLKKVGHRIQKLFGPPAATVARAEPTEEDIARLQRLASHLRREIGKQRAFGADGLEDVLGKAAAGIETHLKK